MKTLSTPTLAAVAPATTCSRIECGHYTNGKGAWMDILDVQMPGYPKYDRGATGVSILWGRDRWFVLAHDEENFWSQFPYSVLKGCFHSANEKTVPTEGGEKKL